jgi:hypothetical protein
LYPSMGVTSPGAWRDFSATCFPIYY